MCFCHSCRRRCSASTSMLATCRRWFRRARDSGDGWLNAAASRSSGLYSLAHADSSICIMSPMSCVAISLRRLLLKIARATLHAVQHPTLSRAKPQAEKERKGLHTPVKNFGPLHHKAVPNARGSVGRERVNEEA